MSNKIVTGGLSAAAALAASSGAYAAIVSIPAPANVVGASLLTVTGAGWDASGDGIADYNFSFRNVTTPSTGIWWQANMNPLGTGANQGVVSRGAAATYRYGTRLAASAVIGPTAPAGVNNTVGGLDSWSPTSVGQIILGSFFGAGQVPYGGWVNPTTGNALNGSAVRGWLGFRVNTPGGLRYGGIDMEVVARGSVAFGGINFFGAWIEDSGAPFVPANIPAPGSVAALALGALACGRRSRRVA